MSVDVKQQPKDKPRKREEVPGKGIHIEAPGQEDQADMVVMLCGLIITFTDDADIVQQGEDFYAFSSGHKANCPECLEAWVQLA